MHLTCQCVQIVKDIKNPAIEIFNFFLPDYIPLLL